MSPRDKKMTPADGSPVTDSAVPREFTDNPKTDVTKRPLDEESPLQAVERRSRETKNNTITTLDRVENLRRETREDIAQVNKRIDKVDAKVDNTLELANEIKSELAAGTAQNEIIIKMIDEQNKDRERSGLMRLTQVTAEVEVSKTRALTDIEVDKVRALTDIDEKKKTGAFKRAVWKKFWFQAIAGAAAILTAALAGGYIFKHC